MSDLDLLRAGGWSVAVHNDYRLNGERWTFWLFTHPDGTWIKGEGRTDDEALAAAHGAWNARPEPNWREIADELASALGAFPRDVPPMKQTYDRGVAALTRYREASNVS